MDGGVAGEAAGAAAAEGEGPVDDGGGRAGAEAGRTVWGPGHGTGQDLGPEADHQVSAAWGRRCEGTPLPVGGKGSLPALWWTAQNLLPHLFIYRAFSLGIVARSSGVVLRVVVSRTSWQQVISLWGK